MAQRGDSYERTNSVLCDRLGRGGLRRTESFAAGNHQFRRDSGGRSAIGLDHRHDPHRRRTQVGSASRQDGPKPNVLAQLSNDPTDGRFPPVLLEKANFKDGELSVRTISGHVDQGANLVWRYRDPNNNYLTRANALEDNVGCRCENSRMRD